MRISNVSLFPLLLSVALAACGSARGAGPDGNSATPGSGSGNDAGTGNGSSGTGNGSSGGTSGNGASDPNTCVPGIPATSQIPRMKDAAYDAVVRDLLGVTGLSSANGALPSSLLVADSDGSLTDIAWTGYLTAADKIAAQVLAGPNKRSSSPVILRPRPA